MAIPKECKRLAEVDFPIATVSAHAVREKSIRHGHPSTLHLWWARRPLGACRAVLLGLLLPDPCDPLCPEEFKTQARELLRRVQDPGADDLALRQTLLKFIGNFANWDLAANAAFLEVAQGLVQAAHPDEPPLVVDPFAGGGSIPLEALRLGCDAFASDLNPVAGMIQKVMLEDIPRHGPGLGDKLRHAGAEVNRLAEQALAEFYPLDPDGARPIAYLWARTVRCENPSCGAEIPLVRSFWLSKRTNRKRALRYRVIRQQNSSPQLELEIFEPKNNTEVPSATVSRAKATCPCCNLVLSPERVRTQLSAQQGGADVVFNEHGQRTGGARLLAVVIRVPGSGQRQYRAVMEEDYHAVWLAEKRLREIACSSSTSEMSRVPDEPTPLGGGSGAGRAFSIRRYGMMSFGHLFTNRQKLNLIHHSGATSVWGQSAEATPRAVASALVLAISKMADTNSVICTWQIDPPRLRATFARQALPMTWDFAEASPLGDGAGNYQLCVKAIGEVVDRLPQTEPGTVELADAMHSPLPSDAAGIWFTDPPYYDAVPYADLSDFFFVWLKRTMPGYPLLHDRMDSTNPLTPKVQEVVQDETKLFDGRAKDRAFFEDAMAQAFAEGRRILRDDGVGCVVFAHKTTEGWEALLSGMIKGGWVISGSWPISTELSSRMRARESAALATSIHLICRPRPEEAPIGDWADVLRELPRRVAQWMERLEGEGIRGADLVFACIGPALEIFSRYRRVETAEGREIDLPEYLAKIWEVVGRVALEQILGTAESRAYNGAAAVLEEDARLTALFLWTLQSSSEDAPAPPASDGDDEEDEADEEEEAGPRRKVKGYSLIFDVARRFAQPLGIHLDDWEGRVIETRKGVVRLLPVSERAGQLFGDEGADAVANEIERSPAAVVQMDFLTEIGQDTAPQVRGRRGRRTGSVADDDLGVRHQATTLDRVHAAMLLQGAGRTRALRALLEAEQERGPAFLRLANALSALYPRSSEEKRLLDAMLLAVPR
ncbi:MAG: DUF1156 domain-containing protein [Anaerolineae bacterium]|nr:DUF1156 domain-containing protein [Anaerolineae bacterium]